MEQMSSFVFFSLWSFKSFFWKPQGSLNKASPNSWWCFGPEEERLTFFIIMGFTLMTQMKPAIVSHLLWAPLAI